MSRVFIKSGDELPSLVADITDESGNVLDISGVSSAKFSLVNESTKEVILNDQAASIINPGTLGKVEYIWQDGDTDNPGDYVGEFTLNWVTNQQQSVPHKAYIFITIQPKLT